MDRVILQLYVYMQEHEMDHEQYIRQAIRVYAFIKFGISFEKILLI